jgi:hypothetical protein
MSRRRDHGAYDRDPLAAPLLSSGSPFPGVPPVDPALAGAFSPELDQVIQGYLDALYLSFEERVVAALGDWHLGDREQRVLC